jgi:hypothetical protein
VLDPNLSAAERQEVLDGIEMIESQTNVRFEALPDANTDGIPDGEVPPNYVRFEQTDGNSSSFVGMQDGEQVIMTSTSQGTGSVAHEIMHALGFYHEQQHPDANNAGNPVTVTPGESPGPNFSALPPDAVLTPYDPDSIMHYGVGVYSGGDITSNPGAETGSVGQRENLSQGDIDAINALYPDTEKGNIFDRFTNVIQNVINRFTGP